MKRALELAGDAGNAGPDLAGLVGVSYAAGRSRTRAAWLGWRSSYSTSRPTGRSIPISMRRPTPPTPAAIAARLGDHLAGPVRFAEMIEAMHRDGARVFVEVGPGSILTPLVESILKDRPHLAVACDPAGIVGTGRAGCGPSPGWLSAECRSARAADRGPRRRRCSTCEHLPPGELASPPTPSTWLVNGSRARPFSEPEQARLGQALPRSPSHGRVPNVRLCQWLSWSKQRHQTARSRAQAPSSSLPGAQRGERTGGAATRPALHPETKRQLRFTLNHENHHRTTELGRPRHRVVPADHAGVSGSAEVDDARVPGERGARRARPSRRSQW